MLGRCFMMCNGLVRSLECSVLHPNSFCSASVNWRRNICQDVIRFQRLCRCSSHLTRKDSRNGDVPIKITGKLKRTRIKIKETRQKITTRIKDIKENVFTIPNGLCVLRIGLAPVLGYLIFDGNYTPALGVFIFAGVTDLLDGFIARTFSGQQSMLGSFLDPMADKFLIATLFLSLTIVGMIPIPLTALIITRDVCLVTAGFYIRYYSLPPPRTISRYFDVTFATAKLSPTTVSKLNTGFQLTLIAATLAAPVFHYVDHPYMHVLWYFVASTTVLSGTSYLFSKNTYKMLYSKVPNEHGIR